MPNSSSKNYYDILGIEPTATTEEIVSMHRKLAKKYHADANSTDPDLQKWSHKMMVELNEAYSVLRDPDKRSEYDGGARNDYDTGHADGRPNSSDEPVYIESWEHARQVMMEGADSVPIGAPTPELEKEANKQLKKNIKKRVKTYLRMGVPNNYPGSYLNSALQNAIADAVDHVQERIGRDNVRGLLMFCLLVLAIIYEFRSPPDGFWNSAATLFFGFLAGGALVFHILTWIARLIAHAVKSNLIGVRGLVVNGIIAIYIAASFGFGLVFSSRDIDGWYLIESPDGKFSILFPVEPQKGETDYFDIDGTRLEASTSKGLFKIEWATVSNFDDEFERFIRRTKSNSSYEVISHREISDTSHLFVLDLDDDKSVVVKMVLDENTFYDLRVLTYDQNINEEFIDKFINSFVIL